MSISESRRHHLHEVQARLDEEAAETLMSLLPPAGWADVATKTDLAHLEQRMDLRFGMVDQRFGMVDQRFGSVEDRLGRVEERLGRVEDRLGRVEERIDGLQSSFVTWLLASQAAVIAVVVGATSVLLAVLG